MSELLEAFEKAAAGFKGRVAIGFAGGGKVLKAAEEAELCDVLLVGAVRPQSSDVEAVSAHRPEEELIKLLKEGAVDAAVRGELSAVKVLHAIKDVLKPASTGRIALLETSAGRDFLFAPVGVDEGNTVEHRLFLALEGVKLARMLGVKPKLSVLSGGREEDAGRHVEVDRSLEDATRLVESLRSRGVGDVENQGILIEDAMKRGSNLILAPNGIAGNLIFRTLAFLGGGRGYGAVMAGIEESYVDTSRAASTEEYKIAMLMACAIAAWKKEAGGLKSLQNLYR